MVASEGDGHIYIIDGEGETGVPREQSRGIVGMNKLYGPSLEINGWVLGRSWIRVEGTISGPLATEIRPLHSSHEELTIPPPLEPCPPAGHCGLI